MKTIAAPQLSPAWQAQVAAPLLMLEASEAEMEVIYGQLMVLAKHMRGAGCWPKRLYGVGPLTALALTCWLGGAGRFSSARKAVRFAGLDITVYSSAGKRSPGHLSGRAPGVAVVPVRGGQDPRPRRCEGPRVLRGGEAARRRQAGGAVRGPQDRPAGQPPPALVILDSEFAGWWPKTKTHS